MAQQNSDRCEPVRRGTALHSLLVLIADSIARGISGNERTAKLKKKYPMVQTGNRNQH